MPRRLVSVCSFFALALLVTGCQKAINLDKTVTLTAGAVEVPANFTAPRGVQRVRISITSAEPIDVDLVLEQN